MRSDQKSAAGATSRKRRTMVSKLVRTVRVMAKPVAGGTLAEYLALVARDRPESS